MNSIARQRLLLLSSGRTLEIPALLLFCFFTGTVRGLLEGLFFDAGVFGSLMLLSFIPFYIALFLGLLLILRFVGGLSDSRVYRVPLAALFLGLFPPILDLIISGRPDSPIRYGYYLEIFSGHDFPRGLFYYYMPYDRVPMGESITVWSTISLSALYAYLQGASVLRTIGVLVATYALFFLHSYIIPSALQSWAKAIVLDSQKFHLRLVVPLVQILVAVLTYAALRRMDLRYTLKRLLHIGPFLLVFIFGTLEAPLQSIPFIILLLLLFLVFFTMIVQNDFFDVKEDSNQNRLKYFRRDDVFFFTSVSIFSLIFLLVSGKNFALFVSLIAVCGILYSFPFYRGKGKIFATMKFEGIWGAMSYLAGVMPLAGYNRIATSTLVVALFIFLGWSFFSLIKDIKDIRADHKAGNSSLYLWFYRKGWKLRRAHHFLMTVAGLALLIAPLVLFMRGQWLAATLMCAVAVLFLATGYFLKIKHRYAGVLVSLNLYLAIFIFAQ